MQAGEMIELGTYPQSETGKDKTPIQWRVLSVENGEAYLLSDKALDYQTFHSETARTSWEECSLKKWLNTDFCDKAFTEKERENILEVTCLSREEAERFLPDDPVAEPTEYANTYGTYVRTKKTRWWLRTMGYTPMLALIVGHDRNVFGMGVAMHSVAVRPALRLKLEAET